MDSKLTLSATRTCNWLTTCLRTYTPTEQWLRDRLEDTAKLAEGLNSLAADMDGFPGLPSLDKLKSLKSFKPQDYFAGLRNFKHLSDHISWNHGKVLAVNGKTMMTGGGNYWSVCSGGQHDIVDQQAKLTGDAAISAHRWADYFWKLVKPTSCFEYIF